MDLENKCRRFKRRSANYSHEEKKLLIQLVGKYESIIEEKKLNSAIVKQKLHAWQAITKLFNENKPNVHRTLESLRKFYKNVKTERRRAGAQASGPTTSLSLISVSNRADVAAYDLDDQMVMVKEEPLSEVLDSVELRFKQDCPFGNYKL